MSSYRFYRLDAARHLHDAEWFDAESDEEAISKIEASHPNDRCEVWEGKRLVASLSPEQLRA